MQTQKNIQEQAIYATQSTDRNASQISSLSAAMIEKVSCRKAIIVLNNLGIKNIAISDYLNCSISTVYRWIQFRIDYLADRLRSGKKAIYTPETHLRIIAFYCQTKPLPGCGRWTLRWAALYLKMHSEQINATPSKSTIQRVLKKNMLKPHLSQYFLNITDPDFFPKMEHLLELYRTPPRFLFFFDECPGIQILKRLTPDYQTEKEKKRLEEFEYIRNGTMDVFAFLSHADGTVYAECHGDHKIVTFIEVFRHHVLKYQEAEELHYVMTIFQVTVAINFVRLWLNLVGSNVQPKSN